MLLDTIQVQSCCYFVSLRTGTKLIGFISIVGCILACALSGWYLAVLAQQDEHIEPLLLVDLATQFVQIITSSLLLLGVYQEVPKFIRPWLISTVFAAVLEVVYESSLVAKYVGFSHAPVYEQLIATLLLLVDDIYGLLVVFSYYRSVSPQGQRI